MREANRMLQVHASSVDCSTDCVLIQTKMLEAAEIAAQAPVEPQNELQRRMVDDATVKLNCD